MATFDTPVVLPRSFMHLRGEGTVAILTGGGFCDNAPSSMQTLVQSSSVLSSAPSASRGGGCETVRWWSSRSAFGLQSMNVFLMHHTASSCFWRRWSRSVVGPGTSFPFTRRPRRLQPVFSSSAQKLNVLTVSWPRSRPEMHGISPRHFCMGSRSHVPMSSPLASMLTMSRCSNRSRKRRWPARKRASNSLMALLSATKFAVA
mmetsp:Transcript_9427/g.26433  ORF Transcript_9427/g.26433 Transcript_9427/m.26433 type:complete len:203 (+) Transcript_9427:331-939(+)